jgi:rubrerythrin
MIAEIAGGLAALKSASELTKAMMDIRDATVVQAKAIELQRQILAAQESALAANERQTVLLERIKSLEEEIAQLKRWEGDKTKYELQNLGTGAFAYVPRPDSGLSEPEHWLCATCFDRGVRGIVQNQGRTKDDRHSIYGCPICKNTFQVHWNTRPGRLEGK